MATKNEVASILHSGLTRLNKRVSVMDRDREITPARYSILSVLSFSGPQTIGSLSRIEGVKPPTMTNLIHHLEKDGLVKRSRSSKDARQSEVAVTAKGRKLLERLRQKRLQHLVGLLGPLNKNELDVLDAASKVLMKLSRSMGEKSH